MRHDRTCQPGFERQRHPAPALRRCSWVSLCLILLAAACSTSSAPPSATPVATGSAPLAPITAYHGHTSTVFAVAWSPDSTRVASTSQDATVQVWDATSGRHLLTYRDQTAPLWSVAWSPSGSCLGSATDNTSDEHPKETVQMWNAATGQLLVSYPVPSSAGYADGTLSIAWSPNSARLALGGADIVVQLWNTPPFCSG